MRSIEFGIRPLYLLSDIFLFSSNIENHYTSSLKNNIKYVTMARRTEIYSKSVIPSPIQLWNELSIDKFVLEKLN